jgi:hypothetical protein
MFGWIRMKFLLLSIVGSVRASNLLLGMNLLDCPGIQEDFGDLNNLSETSKHSTRREKLANLAKVSLRTSLSTTVLLPRFRKETINFTPEFLCHPVLLLHLQRQYLRRFQTIIQGSLVVCSKLGNTHCRLEVSERQVGHGEEGLYVEIKKPSLDSNTQDRRLLCARLNYNVYRMEGKTINMKMFGGNRGKQY